VQQHNASVSHVQGAGPISAQLVRAAADKRRVHAHKAPIGLQTRAADSSAALTGFVVVATARPASVLATRCDSTPSGRRLLPNSRYLTCRTTATRRKEQTSTQVSMRSLAIDLFVQEALSGPCTCQLSQCSLLTSSWHDGTSHPHLVVCCQLCGGQDHCTLRGGHDTPATAPTIRTTSTCAQALGGTRTAELHVPNNRASHTHLYRAANPPSFLYMSPSAFQGCG
jgi:hypothetical protein